MTIDYSLHKNVSNALVASFANQVPNEYSRYSTLWASILASRESIHDLADLLISLNDRFTFSKGIATVSYNANKQRLFIEYYKTLLDRKLLDQFPLSFIGSPSVIDYDGCPASIAYLQNLRLFDELKSLLERYLPVDYKPLHIVEIGAGYGGLAYFLIKSKIACSYTIVDLPENLELSAFYLTQHFPEMTWNVLSNSRQISQVQEGSINFVLPGNIGAIADCKFDLAINSDSLGEMPTTTATAYVRWIYDHLAVGGHFFSKNGHGKGLDYIQLPSQYGYDIFQLIELKPPRAASGLFDDFSHYIFLSKSHQVTSKINLAVLDTLSQLYAAGLHDELIDISRTVSLNGRLDEEQSAFLQVCDQLFSAKSISAKLTLLERSPGGSYNSCISYLKGIAKYVAGDRSGAAKLLAEYIPKAESYIAEAYALMVLAHQDPSILNGPFKSGARTDYILDEIRRYHQLIWPLSGLALKLRAEILRKKITYPPYYSPSMLLALKNLLFNIREGKGWTTTRLG